MWRTARLLFFVICIFVSSYRAAVADESAARSNRDVNAAITTAIAHFGNSNYDFYSGAHCSSFVAEYLKALGFNVGLVTDVPTLYNPREEDPIPNSNTMMQVRRFEALNEQVGGGIAWYDNASALADQATWDSVPVGALIYLQKAGAWQNGYDTWQHVAIYVGTTAEGVVQLAELADKMNDGPRANRSIKQTLDGVYWDTGLGRQSFITETGTPLKAFIVDTLGLREKLSTMFLGPTPPPQTIQTNADSAVMNELRALAGLPAEMQGGGALVPQNAAVFTEFSTDLLLTVNLNDGTTALFQNDGAWTQVPISSTGTMTAFAVIGRELKVEPALTEAYAQTTFAADGSWYDGEYGILWSGTGVPRTTYTPPMLAQYLASGRVDGFGALDGFTDIGFIRTLVRDMNTGELSTWGSNSHYTIHRVPQGTEDQQVLLREPDLVQANQLGQPLAYPTLHRSSGCVNYDAATWIELKGVLDTAVKEGKTVVVMFGVPGIDQNLLISSSGAMMADPLSNINVTNAWSYDEVRDRRGYYIPGNNL